MFESSGWIALKALSFRSILSVRRSGRRRVGCTLWSDA